MNKIKWVFFDIGSTLVDETAAYDHRVWDMISSTSITFQEFDNNRQRVHINDLVGYTPWRSC